MALRVSLFCTLIIAAFLFTSYAKEVPGSTSKSSKRQLKRTTGKRWDSIHEIVRAEIKSATRHFLEERSRALILPIEVDLLLVGFDGDGGYGYQLDKGALEELLGTATEDNTICPTVWETGESAAVCFSVNYITLDLPAAKKGVERIENALAHNMEWMGDRSQDWPDGSREVQVYEVEANGEIEATVWELLDEAYGGKEPDTTRRQHSQIVVINPSKLRMKHLLPPAPPGRAAQVDPHAPPGQQQEQQLAAANMDFIAEWKKGHVDSRHVVEQEAGYLYRYRYNGHGGGAAFVGQYNFLVIDIAAGPVSYGPLAAPSGAVSPTAMPRLMPMLLRMTRELEATKQPGTFREHLLEEAAKGQASMFEGQLGSTLAAATRHLFASDLWMTAAEELGGGTYGEGPRRVVVPIIVLQDHLRELEHEGDGSRWVDSDMVQLALDEMLPPDLNGAVSVSRYMLHHHKTLAAALVKARHSRSDAVLSTPPDVGLHRSHTTSLDIGVLLKELRRAAADDDLMAGLLDHLRSPEDYGAEGADPYDDGPAVFLKRKRKESKILPVFVFSLEHTPDQMMFDNHQLVAADGEVVAVLQLLGNPSGDDTSRGRVYSGHMMEGHTLLMDAAQAPTRSIIAGLASALGGLVPPHQRFCTAERAVVEDWRWAVGAVPWGPHANYTAISSVFAATARRNLLVGRIERPLRRLIGALNRLDAFIASHLMSPFAALRRTTTAPTSTFSAHHYDSPFEDLLPQHHLLDDLARQHVRYQTHNGTAAVVRNLLTPKQGSKPGSKKAAAPKPSPNSSSGSEYPDGTAGTDPSYHEDEGPYDQPIELPPDAVGVGSAAAAAAAAKSMLTDQLALTPNVAQRLQASLNVIGKQLEQISFLMYSRNWAELDDLLPSFAAAVTSFSASVDTDLSHAADVISCCSVRHAPRNSAMWFGIAVLLVVAGTFAVVALVALRSTRLYRPGMLSVSRSSSNKSRSLSSGSLPSWSGPLPR